MGASKRTVSSAWWASGLVGVLTVACGLGLAACERATGAGGAFQVEPDDGKVRLEYSARILSPVMTDAESQRFITDRRGDHLLGEWGAADGDTTFRGEDLVDGFAPQIELAFSVGARGVEVLGVELTGADGAAITSRGGRVTMPDGRRPHFLATSWESELDGHERIDARVYLGSTEPASVVSAEVEVPLGKPRTVDVGGLDVTISRLHLRGSKGEVELEIWADVAGEEAGYLQLSAPAIGWTQPRRSSGATRRTDAGDTETRIFRHVLPELEREPIERVAIDVPLEAPVRVEAGDAELTIREARWEEDGSLTLVTTQPADDLSEAGAGHMAGSVEAMPRPRRRLVVEAVDGVQQQLSRRVEDGEQVTRMQLRMQEPGRDRVELELYPSDVSDSMAELPEHLRRFEVRLQRPAVTAYTFRGVPVP